MVVICEPTKVFVGGSVEVVIILETSRCGHFWLVLREADGVCSTTHRFRHGEVLKIE